MPAISLVVCLCKEGDHLRRLLQETRDCYDDLVVVHDGPDDTGVRPIVENAGGRFFEGKREYQQEPHWPFAWGAATHDWILRLDADEFPSGEMRQWLKEFRRAPEPPPDISGYTCIWPMWNGHKTVSKKWPAGRLFFFHRQRVRFFGMCEQTPVLDGRSEALDFILHHQPTRKSYGLSNILLRKQSRRVATLVALSLLKKPTDLACWRWQSEVWPEHWEQIRQRPLWTAFKRLIKGTVSTLRTQWKSEHHFFPIEAISGPVHQTLICLKFRLLRRVR